jgi:uncharacterized membrane protein YhaH (DUF805 family)
MNYYMQAFRKYAVFSGRARRMEYWMFTVINFAIIFALNMLGGALGLGSFALGSLGGDTAAAFGSIIGILLGFIPGLIFCLVILLPSIAVGVRRLHDTGRSGLWMLLGLIPFVGLILLVFMLIDSQPGDNEYGPNPKGVGMPAMA